MICSKVKGAQCIEEDAKYHGRLSSAQWRVIICNWRDMISRVEDAKYREGLSYVT